MANKNAIPPEHGKFKPGVSGNPKGRPVLPDIKDEIAEALADEENGKNNTAIILKELVKTAKKPNAQGIKAAELVFAYAYGRPSQKIDLNASVNISGHIDVASEQIKQILNITGDE